MQNTKDTDESLNQHKTIISQAFQTQPEIKVPDKKGKQNLQGSESLSDQQKIQDDYEDFEQEVQVPRQKQNHEDDNLDLQMGDDSVIQENSEDERIGQSIGDCEGQDTFIEEDCTIKDEDEIMQQKQEGPKFMDERAKDKKKESKLKLRSYQNILIKNSLNENRIIYLPTGSGKTLIAIASMYYYLCRQGQSKKVVFLANTIQLVKQQAQSIKNNLTKIIKNPQLAKSLRGNDRTENISWTRDEIKQKVCCIHGEKNEELGQTKRKKIQSELTAKKQIIAMFKKGTIFVMISQMFLNSLRRGYIKITDFCFLVFDQCHHCQGEHPYAGIMKQFYFDQPKKQQSIMDYDDFTDRLPKIMGLTASPVAHPSFNRDQLQKQLSKLCKNLNSKFTYCEINSINDGTQIEIQKITESEQKKQYPYLLEHFQRYRDHKQAYDKIAMNFPIYFQCVKQIVECISKYYEEEIGIEADYKSLSDVELLLLYDIKQCLIVKLRDLLLELGEYAFYLAYKDLLAQLNKVTLKTEKNKQTLDEIIVILKKYQSVFSNCFGHCQKKYFSAKVIKLIELLESSNHNEGMSVPNKDMVLVFAAKRRTVKYLQQILKNYQNTVEEDEKKNFQCGSVTGYSAKSFSNFYKNELIYEADPSSDRFQAELEIKYNQQLQKMEDEKRLADINNQGENQNLSNEMKKMKNIKCGKLLLEVEQRYIHQINKISDFRRRKFRSLITTSVTQQGFDIPECNMVISFDEPNSLKSYIQIKGRARKQNSKYYIFTAEKNYQKMVRNKHIFDDTIRITFEIAINSFSGKQGVENYLQSEFRPQKGYKKVRIGSTGAILNTNFALEILKTYCASLRQPNKPVFYFIQTPNIAFRCIVYFPPTSPTDKPFIVGDPLPSKYKALKSASYLAVKYLYQKKYIKGDLRPKKYEQLQQEKQIQRFQDIPETKKNDDYRKIFQEYVRANVEDVQNQEISKKFIRFYFKRISNTKLDFPQINPEFKLHKDVFDSKPFPFQIYRIRFSNTQNLSFLQSNIKSQQVGLLTCYGQQHVNEIYSRYSYSFEQNQSQAFYLELVDPQFMIKKEQYEKLKGIHKFLVAASLQKQHYYYSQLSQTAPVKPAWQKQIRKFKDELEEDKERDYYPIIVLLKKKNQKFALDQLCNSKIQEHRKIFTEVYRYHNVPSKADTIHQKFSIDLSDHIKQMEAQLNASDKYSDILLQSIDREFCFHKCFIVDKAEYSPEADPIKKKRQTLKSKHAKLFKMFKHPAQKIKQVVKIILWRKYKKQKKGELFQRGSSLIKKQLETNNFLLEQFIMYPLTPQTLLKVSLALEFAFKAYYEYSLAFHFKNIELKNIIEQKLLSAEKQPCFQWVSYPSIILDYQNELFNYLVENGSSQYLRNLGKSHSQTSKFKKPQFELSFSKISMNAEQSMIQRQGRYLDDSNNISMLNYVSGLNISATYLNNNEKSMHVSHLSYQNVTTDLQVSQVLKVLTSRMYKSNNADNYEGYEFIGDVLLKMLTTIQKFLQFPSADESQLHIRRANIICNANLHRKCIHKKFFKYILTAKYNEQIPPYKSASKFEDDDIQYYEDTKIQMFSKSSLVEKYQYIPGKVHADVIQALIGAFYLKGRSLQDCQILLYALDILKKPNLHIKFKHEVIGVNSLPKLFKDFQQRIRYDFRNKGLLIQAFTHSSFKSIMHDVIDKNNISQILKDTKNLLGSSQFMENSTINNQITSKVIFQETFYERLQFLGDSILDLIVVQYLYEKYSNKDQGSLTLLKQAGVSNKTLGLIAMRYGMHELLLIQHHDTDKIIKEFRKIEAEFDKYVNNPQSLIEMKMNSIKILGDVFEGLVGAIFIDQDMNYVKTKAIVMQLIKDFVDHFTDMENNKNKNGNSFQDYLDKNNYKNCRIKKDASVEIENGMFKWLLVDRFGHIIKQCWQVNEKRAWDLLIESYQQKNQADK